MRQNINIGLEKGMLQEMPLMRGTDSFFPPLFVQFSEEEQKALTDIINDADLEKLLIQCDLRKILSLASQYADGIKEMKRYFKYAEPTLWGMEADEWDELGQRSDSIKKAEKEARSLVITDKMQDENIRAR